jgi:hypothetical protein
MSRRRVDEKPVELSSLKPFQLLAHDPDVLLTLQTRMMPIPKLLFYERQEVTSAGSAN